MQPSKHGPLVTAGVLCIGLALAHAARDFAKTQLEDQVMTAIQDLDKRSQAANSVSKSPDHGGHIAVLPHYNLWRYAGYLQAPRRRQRHGSSIHQSLSHGGVLRPLDQPVPPFCATVSFLSSHLCNIKLCVQILATELGDETFIIAAIMSMQHPRLVVYAGAMTALTFMTVSTPWPSPPRAQSPNLPLISKKESGLTVVQTAFLGN